MDILVVVEAVRKTGQCIDFADKSLKTRLKHIEDNQETLTTGELQVLWIDAMRHFNNRKQFRQSKERLKQRIANGG